MFRPVLLVAIAIYVVSAAKYHARKDGKDMDSLKKLIENVASNKRQYTQEVCDQIPDSMIFNCYTAPATAADGQTACVMNSRKCNAILNCDNGSDELDCIDEHAQDCQSSFTEKGLPYFQCTDNQMCLEMCRKCDDVCDCLDNSDEKDCEDYTNPLTCQETAEVNMCPE